MSPKLTLFEVFEEIHQVSLDGISSNMVSLFQSGNYGAINTADTTTNGFCVIMFISEAYTLQKIQQLTDKLFLRVDCFLRHNIFAQFKKVLIGIGNNNH